MEHSQPLASSFLKRLQSRLKPHHLLIFLGFSLLTFGAVNYYRVRILSFTRPVLTNNQVKIGNKESLPTQITIPSLEIDLPIEPASINNGVWEISYTNPTFLNSSAKPGTGGNIVIYGHNKKAIFGNLPYLSIGQKIYVRSSDDKIHIYEAYKKDFVAADRVDLVSPTDYEELTIYTCWGLFDSQRVVIKAKPIDS